MMFIFKVYISVMCFMKTLCRIQGSELQVPCIRSDGVKQHPSRRQDLSVQTSICVQKLRTVPGCICSNVSATRLDAFHCSTSKMISFPNTDMGRQLELSRQRGYSVWTLSLIRKDVQKIYNCPDISLHCPDA
jgi:hypothetical protein